MHLSASISAVCVSENYKSYCSNFRFAFACYVLADL